MYAFNCCLNANSRRIKERFLLMLKQINMASYNINLIIVIMLCGLSFFPISEGILYEKPSIFKDFPTFKEVKLSVFDNTNNELQSTFDAVTGVPISHIQVSFEYMEAPLLLDLRLNKGLISPGYLEIVSNSTKKPLDVMSLMCHYTGFVSHVGDKTIMGSVACSTCYGVRAFIILSDDILHIEPMSAMFTGRHLLFRESEASNKFSIFGDRLKFVQNENQLKVKIKRRSRMKREVQRPYDANNETLIVELYVVNDHSQFVSQGSNVEAVINRTVSIANIVNSLFRSLNIYVALVGVEVWSDTDRIQMMDSSEGTMNKFLEYRRRYINSRHPNDNAQMISSRSFGEGVVGKAPIMTMCSWQYSGGINLDHSQVIGRIATTVAHEMGHNFGMTHDTEESKCPDTKCIMSPSSGGSINPTQWSEASKIQLSDALVQGMHHCLHNNPTKIFGDQPVCGDGFVDKGEECDCGLPKDCTSTCCNASTCTFLPHAKCSSGSCCDLSTCQLRPLTYECRPRKGDCDLSEHCDGISEFCPFDIFKHNGYPCTTEGTESYCFNGQCRTHETQCKLLWGRTGKNSHSLCYSKLNVKGGAEGNCGLNLTDVKIYNKCEDRDVMCGMLHCEHSSEKLMFWKESLSFELPDSSIFVGDKRYNCKAAILDVGLDSDNPGLAPDGAKCGDNMMCMSQKCLPTSEVVHQLNCPDCNGNGVCNSLSQCHCNAGWAPPFCDSTGGGGSLHSNQIEHVRTNIGFRVAMGFMLTILFPCLFICIIYLYRRRSIILKKIGIDRYKSISVPVKPPPRPPQQPNLDRFNSKSFNSTRRPPPPPCKPPSPPNKFLGFSNQRDEKYQIPPRLPPRNRIVMPTPPRSQDGGPTKLVDSVGLREALSELQQLNFLNVDENLDVNKDFVEGETSINSQKKLVPFRKAPPPPPPNNVRQGVRRASSLKPPERPPPPPKLNRV